MFKRFAALGDSLTEGVGDPAWFGLRGWADRLAGEIAAKDPELEYVNLARRSLRTAEVIDQQLGPALEFGADLAGAVVGMNDLLNPDFKAERYAADLRRLVVPLQESGAVVLTASFPDVSRGLPLLSASRRLDLHNRLKSAGDVVRNVSRELETVFVDGWEMSARDGINGVMSVDRLHPNARGHALIAAAFADQISARTGFDVEVSEPSGPRLFGLESALHLRWLAVNTIAPAVWRAAKARLTSSGSHT